MEQSIAYLDIDFPSDDKQLDGRKVLDDLMKLYSDSWDEARIQLFKGLEKGGDRLRFIFYDMTKVKNKV